MTTKKKTTKKKTTKRTTSWLPKVGDNVLIRTVTNYFTGRITAVDGYWLALEDAAWIADMGRFHTAVNTGSLSEVEPYSGPCVVARGAIVDVSQWKHDLPRGVR